MARKRRPPVEKNEQASYYPQIDCIKGLAILSVILLHSLPKVLTTSLVGKLTIAQAVPVFFVVFGITSVISYGKIRSSSLSDLYRWDVIRKKIRRYFVPFCIVAVISIIFMGVYNILAGYPPMWYNEFIFCILFGLIPPFGGGGDYFISILFQLIFLSPILYFLYKRSPTTMIAFCFIVDLAFEFFAVLVIPSAQTCFIPANAAPSSCDFFLSDLIYSRICLRYLGIISLGYYFSQDLLQGGSLKLNSNRYRLLCAGAVLSVVYLLLFQNAVCPLFRSEFNTQNVITAFFPVLLVILLWKGTGSVIAGNNLNLLTRTAGNLGKASYHIFIVQAFYFTVLVLPLRALFNIRTGSAGEWILFVAVTLFATILVGYLYYLIDKRLGLSAPKTNSSG